MMARRPPLANRAILTAVESTWPLKKQYRTRWLRTRHAACWIACVSVTAEVFLSRCSTVITHNFIRLASGAVMGIERTPDIQAEPQIAECEKKCGPFFRRR